MSATSSNPRPTLRAHRGAAPARWLAVVAVFLSAIVPAGGLALCIDVDHVAVGLLDRSASAAQFHSLAAETRRGSAADGPTQRDAPRSCPCGSAVHSRSKDDDRGDDHRDIEIDPADARSDADHDSASLSEGAPPPRLPAQRGPGDRTHWFAAPRLESDRRSIPPPALELLRLRLRRGVVLLI